MVNVLIIESGNYVLKGDKHLKLCHKFLPVLHN